MRKNLFTLLFVVLVLFILSLIPIGCNSSDGDSGSSTETGSITGFVKDDSDNGIEGAQCSVETTAQSKSYTGTTDSTGMYEIVNIPVGTWNMTVSRTGYQTNTTSVTIIANEEIEVSTITLTEGTPTPTPTPSVSPSPSTSTVEGYVKDTGGNGVKGIIVSIITTDNRHKVSYSDTSDSNGFFQILNVPQGTWTMTLTGSNINTVTTTVEISGGQTVVIPTSQTTVTVDIGGGGGGNVGEVESTPQFTSVANWQNPRPFSNATWNDHFAVDTNNSMYVGANGKAYRNVSGTWTKMTLPGVNGKDLYGVWGNGNKWYIVGNGSATEPGYIAYTTDNGDNWTQITTVNAGNIANNTKFEDVYGAANGTKVLIVGRVSGGISLCYYSAAGNGTLVARNCAGANVDIHACWVNDAGTYFFAAGDRLGAGQPPLLLKSVDMSGDNWFQSLTTGGAALAADNNIYAIHGSGNSLIAVGGDAGNAPYACYAADFTIHPFNIFSGQQDDMSGGVATIAGVKMTGCYLVASGNAVMCGDALNTNGYSCVVTWNGVTANNAVDRSANMLSDRILNSVGYIGGTYCFAGQTGAILKSTDLSNNTASTANIGNSANSDNKPWVTLNGISAYDADNAVVVGNSDGTNGKTYYTTNAGTTWNYASGGNGNADLYGVYMPYTNKAYAVGANNSSIKWNGAAWADNQAGAGVNQIGGGTANITWNSINGYDANHYYAVGQTAGNVGVINRWNGTNSNWEGLITDANWNNIMSVYALNSSYVIAVGNGSATKENVYIYRGGAWNTGSWAESWASTDNKDDSLNGVYAASATKVFAVGDRAGAQGVIYIWDGSAWTLTTKDKNNNNFEPLIDVAGLAYNYVTACSSSGKIYYYNNTEWAPYSTGTDYTLNGIALGNFGKVFIVGVHESIFHSSNN